MSTQQLCLLLILLAHWTVIESVDVEDTTLHLTVGGGDRSCYVDTVYQLSNNTTGAQFWKLKVDDACLTSVCNSSHQYMEIEVSSDLSPQTVKKLIVTRKLTDLDRFDEDPEEDLPLSTRLSFTSFGMVTVSGSSFPLLKSGLWYVGVTYRRDTWNIRKDTKGFIKVRTVTDYRYSDKFWGLVVISLVSIAIPFLARAIFNKSIKFNGLNLREYLSLFRYWFWKGKKGTAYLVCLVAPLIFVGGFQVSHTRYVDREKISGNHDICYYNERCYRPWVGYYDISFNSFSSNIVFIIHGLIMIFYFSLNEAYCRANKHYKIPTERKKPLFNYSNLYAIGIAFIGEGIGSAIYHICPSQIIFQFDTIFMFIIGVVMIVTIFEGLSYRDIDVEHSRIAEQKSLRSIKVFTVFVGPVFFFNFVGNVLDMGDQHEYRSSYRIPSGYRITFYVAYCFWWLILFLWAAYKLGIHLSLGDRLPGAKFWGPKHSDIEGSPSINDNTLEAEVETGECEFSCGQYIKPCFFVLFFVMWAVLFTGKLIKGTGGFALFILGTLGITLVILTIFFFCIPIYSRWRLTRSHLRTSLQLLYVVITIAVVAVGVYYFHIKGTTNKAVAPWLSREKNTRCAVGDFWDYHDIWHVCSSFGLLMFAMLISGVSKACRICYLESLGVDCDALVKGNHSAVKMSYVIPGTTAANMVFHPTH